MYMLNKLPRSICMLRQLAGGSVNVFTSKGELEGFPSPVGETHLILEATSPLKLYLDSGCQILQPGESNPKLVP